MGSQHMSRQAYAGKVGTSGFGTLASSPLQISTVDLATELTNMIQAWSAYEANSKVFQTGAFDPCSRPILAARFAAHGNAKDSLSFNTRPSEMPFVSLPILVMGPGRGYGLHQYKVSPGRGLLIAGGGPG